MSRFGTARLAAGTAAVRLDGDAVTTLPFEDVGALLRSGEDWLERALATDGESIPLAGLKLATPVTAPEAIVCVGLNYGAHAAEANRDLPEYPQLFAKYTRALTGPHDEIPLPAFSHKVDWEAELAVVIGSPARFVGEAEALDHVAGYTVANDVSVRDWQRRTTQYLQGKTFEHSTPVGPWLVATDELADPGDLAVTCTVDDEVMQQFSTAEMIFTPAKLISYLSRILTLMPGDLLLTGTGPGVGAARDPQRFLASGSVLRTEIATVGTLENRCATDPESVGVDA
jgi:acylpyruvate hydrolase